MRHRWIGASKVHEPDNAGEPHSSHSVNQKKEEIAEFAGKHVAIRRVILQQFRTESLDNKLSLYFSALRLSPDSVAKSVIPNRAAANLAAFASASVGLDAAVRRARDPRRSGPAPFGTGISHRMKDDDA